MVCTLIAHKLHKPHNLHCTGDECAGVDHDVVLQKNVQSEFARSRNRTVWVFSAKLAFEISAKNTLEIADSGADDFGRVRTLGLGQW